MAVDVNQQLYLEGPTTMNMIEDKLFLGGIAAARNIPLLKANGINHILTVDLHPLTLSNGDVTQIVTKFVQAADIPNQDLLSHFDDTDAFIKQGISNGAVLVHCFFGVSRSATIVLAYIMKKYQIPYEKAFEYVRSKRSIIFPNDGFIAQLKMYRQMGYTINKNIDQFKWYKLKLAAENVKKMKILSKEFYDVIQPDPLALPSALNRVYRCKRCKRTLAKESNLMLHKNLNEICKKAYFFELLAWMKLTKADRGKLYCPNCSLEVGLFSWVMGIMCPCGVIISPGFVLDTTKIEFYNDSSIKLY